MRIVNKLTYTIAALFAVVVFIISSLWGGGAAVVHAATSTTTTFEQQNVMDDLKTATINGKPFNTYDYPYDSTGIVKHPEIMTVVEYCYSIRAAQRENYGIYIYFYNPQGLNISTSSRVNKIMLGVKYSTDNDGNIKVDDYEKFDLQFCSKSDGDYRDLFYKFKVIDHKSAVDGKTVEQRVNSNARRYDISEVELLTYGDRNATAYKVGGSYIFTGYAKGYGIDENAESTLACEWKELETVTLDVQHTFYRTKTSSKGAGYQNQIDTVYFSVPKSLLDKYGTLQRIKAEWYEYKTQDIVVTSNADFYNAASPYIGENIGGTPNQFGQYPYNANVGYSLGQNAGDAGGGLQAAKWGWNLGEGYLHIPAPILYYLFKVDNISEYDPYADIVNIGGVESNALYERIKSYNKSFDKGTLPIKDGTISADLFADDIDDYRKMDTEYGKIQQGYSYYDFDADVDLQHLSSWQESNPSFWDNWINWGLFEAIFGNVPQEESRTVSPIYILKDGDLNGTNAEVSDRLLVYSSDVGNIRTFANAAAKKDEVTVLFRFATSDYYSSSIDIMQLGKGFLGSDKYISGQAYRAWESVFFDFDIIQLTFSKKGELTVIPVVSSPVDIVNAITPPLKVPDNKDYWKIIIAILAVILLFVLFYPILSPILGFVIKGLLWLITAPFKALGKLFKRKKE